MTSPTGTVTVSQSLGKRLGQPGLLCTMCEAPSEAASVRNLPLNIQQPWPISDGGILGPFRRCVSPGGSGPRLGTINVRRSKPLTIGWDEEAIACDSVGGGTDGGSHLDSRGRYRMLLRNGPEEHAVQRDLTCLRTAVNQTARGATRPTEGCEM